MPVSHAGPRLEAADLEDAIGALRARGLRVSAARRLVLEAIYAADGPISADEVAGGLGGRLPRSHRCTATSRPSRRSAGPPLPPGPRRGTLRARRGRPGVRGLRLVRRGPEEVRAVLRRDLDYEVEFTHFRIVGLCAGCHEEA